MIQVVIQLHQVAARILAGVLLKEFALVVQHQLAAQGLLALHLQCQDNGAGEAARSWFQHWILRQRKVVFE
jgi:hypothetical protein